MNKTRIGVIGVGELGYRHAFNIAFKVPASHLAAVCSRRGDRAERVRRELEADAAYSDYHDLLADKNVDAVVIASNSIYHPEHIRDSLAAGKHVFCEKPLATDPAVCRELEELVAGYPGQVFFPGFMRRYDPSYRYARELLDRGNLGKPFMISCHSADALSSAERIASIAGTSGGLFLDIGVHDFDLACWFLGSSPKTAYATGDTFLCEGFSKHGDIDNGVAVVNYENGAIGVFREGRTAAHGYHIETEIVCERGSVRVGVVPEKNLVTVCDSSRVGRVCQVDFLERFTEAFILEMQAFVDCVQKDVNPENTVRDSTNATLSACAARDSRNQGRIVSVAEYDA